MSKHLTWEGAQNFENKPYHVVGEQRGVGPRKVECKGEQTFILTCLVTFPSSFYSTQECNPLKIRDYFINTCFVNSQGVRIEWDHKTYMEK